MVYFLAPVSLSDTTANISFQILENSRIFVNAILLSQIERNETLNYTYTLEYDTTSEISSPTQDDSYTFVNDFTCDVCYRVYYSAENCAGGSGTISSEYFELQSKLYQLCLFPVSLFTYLRCTKYAWILHFQFI